MKSKQIEDESRQIWIAENLVIQCDHRWNQLIIGDGIGKLLITGDDKRCGEGGLGAEVIENISSWN